MIDTVLIAGLWQGALIAGIAALVTALVPQRNASTRYAVWFLALIALAAIPAVSQWQPVPALSSLPTSVVHTAAATSAATSRAAIAGGTWLAMLWLAGTILLLSRLALSFVRINGIIRRANAAPALGADVLLSDEITVPVAAGVYAPVVILPTALATALDAADLEGIIRHERAHILRKDVAANVVQRIIEACLFFNPWLYVIARRLVSEREAACDDWAVHGVGDADRYASCLAHVAQRAKRSRTPLLTPSAIGPSHMLVGRIARLLNGKVVQLKVNYLVLGACAVVFSILAVVLQTSNGLASVPATIAANQKLTPKCYHEVRVLNAAMPEIAKSDYRPNASANALVTVGRDGRPVNAKIVKTSGSAAIDRATVNAAMASTYVPKMDRCRATTGQYLFHVDTGPA